MIIPGLESDALLSGVGMEVVDASYSSSLARSMIDHFLGDFDWSSECLHRRRARPAEIMKRPPCQSGDSPRPLTAFL